MEYATDAYGNLILDGYGNPYPIQSGGSGFGGLGGDLLAGLAGAGLGAGARLLIEDLLKKKTSTGNSGNGLTPPHYGTYGGLTPEELGGGWLGQQILGIHNTLPPGGWQAKASQIAYANGILTAVLVDDTGGSHQATVNVLNPSLSALYGYLIPSESAAYFAQRFGVQPTGVVWASGTTQPAWATIGVGQPKYSGGVLIATLKSAQGAFGTNTDTIDVLNPSYENLDGAFVYSSNYAALRTKGL